MLNSRPVNLDVDNIEGRVPVKGIVTGSKTPGRSLLKSRTTLRENLVGTRTVGRVGNNSKNTPFRLKTQQGLSKPLLDKTPFHNRQNPLSTPAPQAIKIAKLSIEETQEVDAPFPGSALLRPSSTRRSLRGRLSGSNNGSAEKAIKALQFHTPVNQGQHWDVSDISIEVPAENDLKAETTVEDYEEVEYMPPKQPDVLFEPSFDFKIPSYKEVGSILRSLAQGYKFDDSDDLLHAQDIEIGDPETIGTTMDALKFSLPKIGEDYDPFLVNRPAPGPSKRKIVPAMIRKSGTPASIGKTAAGSSRTLNTRSQLRETSADARHKVIVPQSTVKTVRAVSKTPRSTLMASQSVSTIRKIPNLSSEQKSANVNDTRRSMFKAPTKQVTLAPKTGQATKPSDVVLLFNDSEHVDEFKFVV